MPDHRPRLPFFVYGTLRPGELHHARLLHGRVRSVTPAVLPGARLYDGPGYPYAVPDPRGTVRGELIDLLPEFHDAVTAELDHLEEYVPHASGNLYERVVRQVWCDDRPAAAWVYLAGDRTARTLRESGRRIPGGDWRNRFSVDPP